MASDNKPWQAAVAIAGLAVSLFGNWIQYQPLYAKKIELEQAQTKLDEAIAVNRSREDRAARKRSDMEARVRELDSQIENTYFEERRGIAGLAFAPLGQKDIAAEIVNSAQVNRKKLIEEKQQLQDKIDALPIE